MNHNNGRRNGHFPGNQRRCIYAMKGNVSWRLCTQEYRCASCEFAQMMDDRVEPLKLQPLRREEWERKTREDELERILAGQHAVTA
jgi:hypothetical protein